MASRSRLGKGLGALFPTLPGEDEDREKDQQEKPAADVSRETSARAQQRGKSSEAQHDAGNHATATTGEVRANSVKSGRIKRAAVPALGDLTHPADMFFGGDGSSEDTTSGLATPSVATRLLETVDNRNIAIAPGNTHGSIAGSDGEPSDGKHDVSRETSKEYDAAPSSNDSTEEPLKPVAGGYLAELNLVDIGPNVHQPRTIFDEDDLMELADSIKEVGVLQPIVVRRRPKSQIVAAQAAKAAAAQVASSPQDDADGSHETPGTLNFADRMDSPYELIMGERRWRASQIAGLKTIPAIVKTTSDDDMLRDALLENLHRVALNPLEEAAAYQQMIKEFGLTQEQLAKSVSKSRPQIANMLRLLQLPAAVQKKVASGVLSAGHARALLGLDSVEDMEKLAIRIIGEGLSVRSTEEIVAMMTMTEKDAEKPKAQRHNNVWAGSAVQQSLENRFETKVAIKGTRKHGRIEITFSSPEDMDRIMALLNPDASKSDGWV